MPLGISKLWRASSRLGRVCRLSPLSLSLPQIPRAAFSSNDTPPSAPPSPDPVVVSYSRVRSGKGRFSSLINDHTSGTQGTEVVPHSKAKNLSRKSDAAAHSKAQSAARQSIISRLERVPVRPHGALPVVIGPWVQQNNDVDTYFSLRKHFLDLSRHDRMEKRRWRASPADWRIIIQNLISSTLVHDPTHHTVKVIVDQRSLDSIMRDYIYNPWDLASWSGCHVTVCSRDNLREGKDGGDMEEDGKPFLLVSGPSASVTAAVNALLKAGKQCTVRKLWSGDEAGPRNNWRFVPDSFKAIHIDRWYPVESYHLRIRADEIPRPAPGTWTKEVFTNYVSALVNGRVTDERKLYGDVAPYYDLHRRAVVKLLKQVFFDPEIAPAVSLHGLKLALHYLGKNNLVAESLDIFRRGIDMGLPLDAAVFNLLSETAKNKKDMMAFEVCVKRMLTNQVRPSFRTWRLFLDLVEAEEVKRYILQAMHTKRFFESRTHVLGVIESMAGTDAYRALQLGQNLQEFFHSQKEIYGPEWRLSTVSANKIITTFGASGQFGLITELVKYMLVSPPSAKCKPDNHTLAILLTHSQRHDRFDLAFQYIAWFEHKKIKVDEKSKILTLFTMAWRNTLPHLASAVFRYAYLNNTIPWQIKRGVVRWLQDNKLKKRLVRRSEGFWEDGSQVVFHRNGLISDLLFWDFKTIGKSTGDLNPQAIREFDELPPSEQYRQFSGWAWRVHRTHSLEDSLIPFLCEALKKDYEMEVAAQMKLPYVVQPAALQLAPRKMTQSDADRRTNTDFSSWFKEQNIEQIVQADKDGDGEGIWGSPDQGMGALDEVVDLDAVDDEGEAPSKIRRVVYDKRKHPGVRGRTKQDGPATEDEASGLWNDKLKPDALNKEDQPPASSPAWNRVQQDIIEKFKDISYQNGVDQEAEHDITALPKLWDQFEKQVRGKDKVNYNNLTTKKAPQGRIVSEEIQDNVTNSPGPTVFDEIQNSIVRNIGSVGVWDQNKIEIRGARKFQEKKVRAPKSGWRSLIMRPRQQREEGRGEATPPSGQAEEHP